MADFLNPSGFLGKKKESESKELEPADLARSMAQIYQNTIKKTWLSESDALDSYRSCYDLLQRLLEKNKELTISMLGEAVMANGEMVEPKTPVIRTYGDHLRHMEVGKLTMTDKVDADSFERLIRLLNRHHEGVVEEGGFAKALETEAIKGVTSKKVVYKEVSEEEEIVSKDEVSQGSEAATQKEDLERIIQYLKGKVSSGDTDAVNSIQEVAADARQMAALILESVISGQAQDELSSLEGQGDEVVSSLQHAFEGLMQHPSAKTQKGKKAITRTLKRLEKEILSGKNEEFNALDKDAKEKISTAIEEMSDEVEIDALASSYAKKKNQVSDSEMRIVRFMRSKGLDKVEETDLQQRLMASGIDQDAWQELLRKSGISHLDNTRAMGQLAIMLEQLEGQLASPEAGASPEHAQKIVGRLQEVKQEILTLAATTENKIHELVDNVHADIEAVAKQDAVAKEKGEIRLSRAEILEKLAEIVQELCQPIAVINCSLDMLTSKYLGDITEMQEETIGLASESTAKVTMLIDGLMGIAGVPETLSPDHDLQDELYKS